MPTAEAATPRVDSVDGIASLDPATWDRLAGYGGLFASHRLISSVEDTEPVPGARGSVAVARAGERVVGALPAWRGLPVGGGRYDPAVLTGTALPDQDPAAWRDTVVLGTRMGYSNVIAVDRSLPPAARAATLRSLVDAAADGAQAAAYCYLDADDAAAALAAMPGAAALLTDANTALDLPPGGVEEYLSTLPSKRRVEVRRELRRFAESRFEVEHTTLARAAPELGELAARRLRKYHQPGADPEMITRVLSRYGEWYGDDAMVLLARESGRAVAYVSVYRWGRDLYSRSWGTVSDDRRSALYFNMIFYEPIRRAAELGARRLHLGLLSYEAKLRRGATLQPRWSVLRSDAVDSAIFTAAAERHNAAAGVRFAALDPDAAVSLPPVPVTAC